MLLKTEHLVSHEKALFFQAVSEAERCSSGLLVVCVLDEGPWLAQEVLD